ATFMGHLARSLQEDQAGIGIDAIDAPAGGLAEQALVIQLWIGSKQTQPKTALALDHAVAGAGITAQSAEQRNHVTTKQRLDGCRGILLSGLRKLRVEHEYCQSYQQR